MVLQFLVFYFLHARRALSGQYLSKHQISWLHTRIRIPQHFRIRKGKDLERLGSMRVGHTWEKKRRLGRGGCGSFHSDIQNGHLFLVADPATLKQT